MIAAISPRNVTFSAVAVLLFLVSVPRVHQLAVQDNQRDAQSAVLALANAAFYHDSEDTPGASELSRALSERLSDVRYDKSTGLIQRHGYFFEVSSPYGGPGFVRAWPVDHGETGVFAYLLGPDAALMSHQNAGAIWSGSSAPRPTGKENGWSKAPSGR